MALTPMQKRYQRFPRLMFLLRRLQRINYEHEMKLLDILCDRGKTAVDVGAKLGMYTFRLLPHARDVVAFEPVPVLSTMLRHNFGKRRVRVEPCALSDAPGRTTMRIPYGSDGEVKFGRSTIERSNALAHDDVARVEEIEVELKTLDQYDLRGLGFIKIDVEGHELAVLGGALATLARETPNLLIESNDHHHPDAVAKLRALLTARDYEGFFLRGGKQLVELATITDPAYFGRAGIENFIFIHRTRPDVRARLLARRPLAT